MTHCPPVKSFVPTRAFCTVVTKSYLPYAWALGESLTAAGNLETLHVLVTDQAGDTVGRHPSVVLWPLSVVAKDFPALMPYYFDAFEFCNALKPFFVSHLLSRIGLAEVIYLDADVAACGSFGRVWSTSPHHSLVVTGHHLRPPPLAPHYSREIEIVDLGIVNGGFALWRRSAVAEEMLGWLKTRLPAYGFCDPARRMYVDQKLLPLLLAYFPDSIHFSRDPTLNIAYWNVHERDAVRRGAKQWAIGDADVVFFHFSGYRVARPSVPSSYLTDEGNAEVLRRAPWFREVLTWYSGIVGRALTKRGSIRQSYLFATFNGIALNQHFRRVIFERGTLRRTEVEFWKIKLWYWARAIKRLLRGIRPLS
jgi:hypothetical protein